MSLSNYNIPVDIVEHVGNSKKQFAGKLTYGFADTRFGRIIAAKDSVGICALDFVPESDQKALTSISERFGNPQSERDDAVAQSLAGIFRGERFPENGDPKKLRSGLTLSLYGTPFQIAVWKALLAVPCGQCTSYSQIARAAGYPQAIRAAASAVGSNPVSLFVPCHRIIRLDGSAGGYLWGLKMKKDILQWESAPVQFKGIV